MTPSPSSDCVPFKLPSVQTDRFGSSRRGMGTEGAGGEIVAPGSPLIIADDAGITKAQSRFKRLAPARQSGTGLSRRLSCSRCRGSIRFDQGGRQCLTTRLTGYRIFIASPGGLAEIRTAFRNVLEKYNVEDAIRRKEPS